MNYLELLESIKFTGLVFYGHTYRTLIPYSARVADDTVYVSIKKKYRIFKYSNIAL